jgi:hypothetical protein
MAVKKVKDKKQLIYLIVFIVMISVSGFLVYNNFLKTPEQFTREDFASGGSAGYLTGFQTPENLTSYLNDLKKFGDWPVTIGELGRSNPFLPL